MTGRRIDERPRPIRTIPASEFPAFPKQCRANLIYVRYKYQPTKGGVQIIPDKLKEIMEKDGVVAIATLGPDGQHMVNTWNSYLRISKDERLFIPAGYMHKTEANIAHDPNILITLGSSKVVGLHGTGAGFLIKGKARFVTSGPDYDFMKEKFSWLRATLAVTIETATQTW
jgi:hypothetical protein